MASPVAEHVGFSRDVQGLVSYGFRPLKLRLNSCGTRAELLQGMCCPHRSRIEPMSPKLTDRFFNLSHQGSAQVNTLKLAKEPHSHESEHSSLSASVLDPGASESKHTAL